MMKDCHLNYTQMNGIKQRVKVAPKMLAFPCQFFEEKIKSPGRTLGVKTNQEALDIRECEEFETAL